MVEGAAHERHGGVVEQIPYDERGTTSGVTLAWEEYRRSTPRSRRIPPNYAALPRAERAEVCQRRSAMTRCPAGVGWMPSGWFSAPRRRRSEQTAPEAREMPTAGKTAAKAERILP